MPVFAWIHRIILIYCHKFSQETRAQVEQYQTECWVCEIKGNMQFAVVCGAIPIIYLALSLLLFLFLSFMFRISLKGLNHFLKFFPKNGVHRGETFIVSEWLCVRDCNRKNEMEIDREKDDHEIVSYSLELAEVSENGIVQSGWWSIRDTYTQRERDRNNRSFYCSEVDWKLIDIQIMKYFRL